MTGRTGAEGDDPHVEELAVRNPQMELVPPVLPAAGAVLVVRRLLRWRQQGRGSFRHCYNRPTPSTMPVDCKGERHVLSGSQRIEQKSKGL